jgi:citrate synthase
MSDLKLALRAKINEWRPRTKALLDLHGEVVVDKVKVNQIIGGMRGIKCLVTDISYLDPNEGIRYRGYTLSEVFQLLPKGKNSEIPYVEGLLYLLLTGDVPNATQVNDLIDEFSKRRILPRYVY